VARLVQVRHVREQGAHALDQVGAARRVEVGTAARDLFGRRFFETLAGLTGDRGAREVLREAAEFVTDVPTPGRAAVVDLDTPEDWAAWRAQT
jgi:CTP:molybdopterin cytidylyltransferase MocA